MREYQPEEMDACRCYGGPLFCDHCAGGTFAGPDHPNCGVRSNMHEGCIDCCPCDECGMHRANDFRRAEVDAWLREIGAHVVQVKDLGAALVARWKGGVAVEVATAENSPLLPNERWRHQDAAHLARVALGSCK